VDDIIVFEDSFQRFQNDRCFRSLRLHSGVAETRGWVFLKTRERLPVEVAGRGVVGLLLQDIHLNAVMIAGFYS
jgi:hypothetical protein